MPSPTRRTRSGRRLNSALYKPVKSVTFSHVRHISDAKNLIYATLDWENVAQGSLYQTFHRMFLSQMDGRTKEILDVDLAIHPFSLAAKMESDDFPGFREIMRMDLEERNRWLDSMDEELQALFDQGTVKFVPMSKALEQGEEIVKTTWAFRRKRRPSGEVY